MVSTRYVAKLEWLRVRLVLVSTKPGSHARARLPSARPKPCAAAMFGWLNLSSQVRAEPWLDGCTCVREGRFYTRLCLRCARTSQARKKRQASAFLKSLATEILLHAVNLAEWLMQATKQVTGACGEPGSGLCRQPIRSLYFRMDRVVGTKEYVNISVFCSIYRQLDIYKKAWELEIRKIISKTFLEKN